MKRIEALLDLFLAGAAASLKLDGPVVVVHSGQHHFPLLDQACALAWLQRSRPLLADFRVGVSGQPAPRPRFALAEALEPAAELLQRSSLALLALPDLPSPAETELDNALCLALSQAPPAGGGPEWLVYGVASSPAWGRGWATALLPRLRPLAAPAGMRMVASAGVLAALSKAGWSAALPLPDALRRAATGLVSRSGVQVDVSAPSTPPAPTARPRLRVRPSAASCIAAHGEATRLLIGVRGKALLGRRGSASVLLPWEACDRARLLISNIRGRIDGLLVAQGQLEIAPTKISYSAQGAMVQIDFGPAVPSAGRWLHLGLPRSAWPPHGCCELSAVEFTAELP